MKKGKYTMVECKKMLNKGLQSLTDDEKRNVISSLAIHLGVSEESIKNWIGGGLPRSAVDKDNIYTNLDKRYWYLLRDIFDIVFNGKKFEEEKEVKSTKGTSIDEIMKMIDSYTSKERGLYFKDLRRRDFKLYNEISMQYNLHRKYGGEKPKANIARYSKIDKKQIREEKENSTLDALQKGNKVRGFGGNYKYPQ